MGAHELATVDDALDVGGRKRAARVTRDLGQIGRRNLQELRTRTVSTT